MAGFDDKHQRDEGERRMKIYTKSRLIIFAALIILITVSACQKKNAVDSGIVDRYNRGITYLERGEYKNAITEFEAVLRADPNNFDALKNLAGAYVYDENMYDARDTYLKARDMHPDDASVYAGLGYVYQQLGENELAWENIQKSFQNDPNYPLAHYVAGEWFLSQGMEDEAVNEYRAYLALEPHSRFAFDAQSRLSTLHPGEDFGFLPGDMPLSTGAEDMAGLDISLNSEETELDDEELTEEEQQLEEEAENEDVEEEVEEPEEEVVDETPEEEVVEEEPVEEVVEEPESEPEPELTGDALYQDRLSRGRQMRAIGSTDAAIRLLLEAYEVHPNFKQVNYELGMAYLAAGQTGTGVGYLEAYIQLETDPAARAEVQERIDAINGNSSDTSEEEDTSDDDDTGDDTEDEG
jgi:tetratricopeptide (TPR) repeat protein